MLIDRGRRAMGQIARMARFPYRRFQRPRNPLN
jgi:hypothetical protein